MLANWIYSNPTWLWGPVLVAAFVAVSCSGLLVFNRVLHPKHRAASSAEFAAVFTVIGAVYAVLIAFVAVAAWQAYSDANRVVQEEAEHISNMYRDVAGLEPADAERMHKLLYEYTKHVDSVEWAAQMAGKPIDHKPGREILARLHLETLALGHGGKYAVVQAEVFRELNKLYEARRARHLAAGADAGIPAVIWCIILIGTSLMVFTSYMLAVASVRLHMLLVALASSSIALVVLVVVDLDQPFRGDLAISKEPYTLTMDQMAPPGERGRK